MTARSIWNWMLGVSAMGGAALLAMGAPPTSAPTSQSVGNSDIEWMLTTGKEPSATQPTSQPTSPFVGNDNERGLRRGFITLSDGEKVHGKICTTREQPIRVWSEADKEFRDVPFALIKSLEAKISWERDEKEWHFKDSGSDIKEYSGKTYPARELTYKVTLLNGQSVEGGIVAPLYMPTIKDDLLFVLNKRQKGEPGQTLKQLTYVMRVDLE